MDRRTTETIEIGVFGVALFLLGFIVGHALFSRSAGAVPIPPTALATAKVTATAAVRAEVTATPISAGPSVAASPSATSLEVKVGQLIMAGFTGQTVGPQLNNLIETYHLGNVVLLRGNTGPPADVLALTTSLQERARAANGVGMLIAADQEGGRVIRLPPPFVQFPAAREIGCIGEPRLTRLAAKVTGAEMRAVGINVDLAPVADVVDNPANQVIGDRSFGTTPDEVVKMVPAYVAGLHDSHVAATLKHFAGHGSTSRDSHVSVVTVRKTLDELEQTELPPFRAGVRGGTDGANLVMMANVGYTALDPSGFPASLSKRIVDFLRSDIGFNGVIVTDDLQMGAIQQRWTTAQAGVMALQAGVDLLLVSSPKDVPPLEKAIVEAVHDGTLTEARINESLQRIQALKQRLASQVTPPLSDVGSEYDRGVKHLIDLAASKEGCSG